MKFENIGLGHLIYKTVNFLWQWVRALLEGVYSLFERRGNLYQPGRIFVLFFLFFTLGTAPSLAALTTEITSGATILNQGDDTPLPYVVTLSNTGLFKAYNVGVVLNMPPPGISDGISRSSSCEWALSSGASGTAPVSISADSLTAILPDIDLESGDEFTVTFYLDTRKEDSGYGPGCTALGSTELIPGTGYLTASAHWSDTDSGSYGFKSPSLSPVYQITVEPPALVITLRPLTLVSRIIYDESVTIEYTLENHGLGDIIDLDTTATVIGDGFGRAYDISVSDDPANPGNPENFGLSFPSHLLIKANTTRLLTFKVNVQDYDDLNVDLHADFPCSSQKFNYLNSWEFILQNPDLVFSEKDLDFNVTPSSSDHGSVTITNTGEGPAQNIVIALDSDEAALTVSNVSSEWNWDGSKFTFIANGGTLTSGSSSLLSFDVTAKIKTTSPCGFDGNTSGNWLLRPDFTNVLGVHFTGPVQIQTYNITNLPEASLNNIGSERVSQGDDVHWTLTPTFSSYGISDTTIVTLTDTIPSEYENITYSSLPANITATVGVDGSGISTVTFQGELQYMNGAVLGVDGNTKIDVENVIATANAKISTVPVTVGSTTCSIEASNDSSTYIQSSQYNPETGVSQDKNVIDPVTFTVDQGPYHFSTTPTLGIINRYDFGTASGRTFTGSQLVDDLGGSGTIVTDVDLNEVKYSIDGGTSWVVVPPDSITREGSGGDYTSLTIDLAFLSLIHGVDDPAGTTLEVRYLITVSDTLSRDASTNPLTVTELTLGGTLPSTTYQGVYLPLTRVDINLSLSGLSNATISQYDTRTMTLNITPTASDPPSDTEIRIDRTNYEIDSITNVVGANSTISSTSDEWIITLGDDTGGTGDLTSNVTITFDATRKCSAGSLDVQAIFKDGYPNTPTLSRTVSDSPALNVYPEIQLASSPSIILIKEWHIDHTVFIANSGDGNAHHAVFHENLNAPLEFFSYVLDNGSAIPTDGQNFSYDFGVLSPNETHQITFSMNFTNDDNCAELPTDAIEFYVRTGAVEPLPACTVSSGGRPIIQDYVESRVCIIHVYRIGGTVTGLIEGNSLILQNNNGDDLAVSMDGAYTFPATLPDASAFNVTILKQPDNPVQKCVVSRGEGILSGADVTNIDVSCTSMYKVGGTVTGLIEGNSLILQNNNGDGLAVSMDGAYTFPATLPDASAFNVTVLKQPDNPVQECVVSRGEGILSGADVTDVDVSCSKKFPWAMFLPGMVKAGRH